MPNKGRHVEITWPAKYYHINKTKCTTFMALDASRSPRQLVSAIYTENYILTLYSMANYYFFVLYLAAQLHWECHTLPLYLCRSPYSHSQGWCDHFSLPAVGSTGPEKTPRPNHHRCHRWYREAHTNTTINNPPHAWQLSCSALFPIISFWFLELWGMENHSKTTKQLKITGLGHYSL